MRKITSAALALALAGGVYLTTVPAQASNMGFKLEREFAHVAGGRNQYLVSFPLFNGLGDISNGTACLPAGMPGDGIINPFDAVCDLFTDRFTAAPGAVMSIQKRSTATCQVSTTTLLVNPGPSFLLFGSFTDDLTGAARESGYYINVTKAATDPNPLVNRAVIVGSHDPSFAGQTFSRAGCIEGLLNLPYHTMYRTANELLCGLESVDWVDADGNDKPDTCPNGVYDPVGGRSVTVQQLLNAPGQFNVPRTAIQGLVDFIGTNFDLTPGDAYQVLMSVGYQDRTVSIPHF